MFIAMPPPNIPRSVGRSRPKSLARHDNRSTKQRKGAATRRARVKRVGDVIVVAFFGVVSLGVINTSRTAIADADATKVQVETLEFSQFPIPGSHYESTSGTSFEVTPAKVDMPSLKMNARISSPGTPLPDSGEAVSSTAVVNVVLSFASLTVGEWDNVEIYDLMTGVGVSNAPPADLLAFGAGVGPPAGTWALELESFEASGLLTGAGDPVPFVLRESPALASLGQHILTPLPDGGLHINSFFDVFFELSYDGGPFVPADNRVRLDITAIVPEPTTAVILGTAIAVLSLLRRRGRRADL